MIYAVTAKSPINIAIVKYWGKRDGTLNLPTNSSFSVTLDTDVLCSHTTVYASADFTFPDQLLLNLTNDENSKPGDDKSNVAGLTYITEETTPRAYTCLKLLRGLRKEIEQGNTGLPKLSSYALRIVSRNNFPTAAGLASSASGYAALVTAVAKLFDVQLTKASLSGIARQGSGSACRSLHGGFVEWSCGIADDGSDSLAFQVAPARHWKNLKSVILVTNTHTKSVSSSEGMKRTVQTSDLFKQRAAIADERIAKLRDIVLANDFAKFAEICMRDSNTFHSLCLDSYPPIKYLSQASFQIIDFVNAINEQAGGLIAAYTFDAGPNAVIFYEEQNESRVVGILRKIINVKQTNRQSFPATTSVDEGFYEKFSRSNENLCNELTNAVKLMLMSGVGDGTVIDQNNHIANTFPKQMKAN